jgi:RNA recognition motif-containing protein
LPYEIEERDLRDFFDSHNVAVDIIRFPRGDSDKRSFGYAEFKTLDDLKEALALNNTPLHNRPLKVDVAGQREEESRLPVGGASKGERSDRSHLLTTILLADGARGGGRDGGRSDGEWRRTTPPPS